LGYDDAEGISHMTLGLVCDACDALSPINATVCQMCGASLGVARNVPGAAQRQTGATAVISANAARNCEFCGADVIPGHRFCGNCGKPVGGVAGVAQPAGAGARPGPPRPGKTMFFGAMQAPSPKLILIKGEGMDGVSYVLSSTEHIAGRLEGAILFPEDPLLSPRHANFIYRDGRLHVRDEGSANGVFLRILKPVTVPSGSMFLVGEQLLRVDGTPPDTVPVPDGEGTYFYGSPKRPSRLALTQLLAGGHAGMIFRARNDSLSIGREGNDVNFPDDPFISGRHATVTAVEGPGGTQQFQLADLNSKNGTFVRIGGEAPLFHGDYVFLGQQLLRVEIT
jgi:pSer/pThr/pTyr-binding forkhead associated (FHA) protein